MNVLNMPPLSQFGVNSYLVWDENMNGTLIDAPYGGDYILKQIAEKGVKLKKILLTHGHCDHIASAAYISYKTGAEIVIHTADREKLTNNKTNLTEYFGLPPIDPVEAAAEINDGDIVTVGELEFEVLHTPGHTSGSVCYILGDNMYCGDTLFKNSMGRTDMPDGSEKAMYESLAMLYDFDTKTDYKLFSGHGASSSMFEERAHNPYMKYAWEHFAGEE